MLKGFTDMLNLDFSLIDLPRVTNSWFTLSFSMQMLTDMMDCGVDVNLSISQISISDVKNYLLNNPIIAINPNYSNTIQLLKDKFNICIDIPKDLQKISLGVGDKLLIAQVTGLPRIGGVQDKFTDDQIASCDVRFYLIKIK